jgi:hypothetical protein
LDLLGNTALAMLTFQAPAAAGGTAAPAAAAPATTAPAGSTMYAVGKEQGTILTWQTYRWATSDYSTDAKPFAAIAFDNSSPGNLWGLSRDHEIMQWNPTYMQWEGFTKLSELELAMLTFDPSNRMWGVGTDKELYYWDDETKKWKQPDGYFGKNITWLSFAPSAPAPAPK